MSKKTIKDIDLKGKKVLVRCDFNVPMDEERNITDNTRIVAALPTIKYLLENNCAIILCSHLGRPKGEFKPEFSLEPVSKELSKLLDKEVIMAKDVIGEDAKQKAENLKPGQIMLLENVRFHREETDNDPEFAKKLASFADIYVNDAFGTAHRAHASTAGVAAYLPAVSGFLIEKEINFMGAIITNENVFLADKMRSSDWASKLANYFGLDGVIISEEGFGNPDSDLIMNCKKAEAFGIKTCIVTDEYAGRDGSSQSLADADVSANAVVTAGNANVVINLPKMDKIIGMLDYTDKIAGGFEGSLKPDGSIEAELQVITGATNELGFNKFSAMGY